MTRKEGWSMKKFLALCLAACLLGTAVFAMSPPAREENLDAALAEITLLVKNTLDIPDDYTDFSGNYDDYLAGQWYLYWSKEDQELSVTANAEGKVMELHLYKYTEQSDNFYGFDPAFPALSRAEAEAAALAWLDKLLGPGESARMDSCRISLSDGDVYRFAGTVCLNGLPSPISFSLRLDGDRQLTSFSRSDSYGGYVGDVPAPEAKSTEAAAFAALAGAVDMELYWVAEEGGASLRYVPCWPRTVVEADTGKPVDMEALYESFYGMGGTGGVTMEAMEAEAPAAAMDNGRGLTEVELASIENYAGAMSAEELDGLLRAVDALGLDAGFELKKTDYAMDAESGDITASVRYTKAMSAEELYGYSAEQFKEFEEWGESLNINKYISLDAKTGELISVRTNYPLWELDEQQNLSEKKLEDAAESFLAFAAADVFAMTGRCDLSDYEDSYVWAQLHEGYFFPENRLRVSLNAATGLIDSYSRAWEEEIKFGSTDILSKEEAIGLYTEGMDFVLGYAAWPEELDENDPLLRAYIDWGYTWVESLKLAWYFEDREAVEAVDAVSGDLVRASAADAESYVYDDLALCAQKEDIEALAAAGIGLPGGSFRPEEALDQRTAVILLEQAGGSRSAADWDDERLGENAAYHGFVAAADWKPAAEMTRMEFIRAIVNASRYGDAAKLEGIWAVSFKDGKDISDKDLACAALAQALGMVTEQELRPDDICTRAEAAGILAGFMKQ